MIFNLFGCSHKRCTWPQTDRRTKQTTVTCLSCGRGFLYDFREMRRGPKLDQPESIQPCPVMAARRTA
jgi:hypothetical protein